MPARPRPPGDVFATGLHDPLLTGLDGEIYTLLETAAEPLERGLRLNALQWRKLQSALAGRKKKKYDANSIRDRDTSHPNGKANGAADVCGRSGARSKGWSGASFPGPFPASSTCLWSCAVLSCFVLSIVISTVTAILVYKGQVAAATVVRDDAQVSQEAPVPLLTPPSQPAPAEEAGKQTEEDLPASKEPWWEVLRKRRAVAQGAVNVVKGLALNNVAKEPDAPEFECHESNGELCSHEDSKDGPPDHLIKDFVLSRADRALFRSVARYKVGREEIAERVTNPSIAFLFLTRGPMPLAPLWERFFQGQEGRYTLYVHTNPTYKFSEQDSLLFRNARIASEQALWGSPRMIDAERRVLAHALANPTNLRFILLSESCVPLRSFDDTWEYLFSTNLSFIESVVDPSPWGQGRYSIKMRPDIKPFQWRKGSQWWSMGRKHAYMMIEDRRIWFKIQRYCRGDKWHRHCYADEHYFQTLLHIHDPEGLANRSVTMSDWSSRSWHPKLFSNDNTDRDSVRYYRDMTVRTAAISIVDEGLACGLPGEDYVRLCFLFLRKVEPSALKPLLNMAGDLLGF